MDITIRSAVNEESLVNNAGNVGERNPQLTCTDCGKVVKSAGGLKNHQRSCRTKHGQTSVDNSAENLHVDDEQPNVQPVLVFETDINDETMKLILTMLIVLKMHKFRAEKKSGVANQINNFSIQINRSQLLFNTSNNLPQPSHNKLTNIIASFHHGSEN